MTANELWNLLKEEIQKHVSQQEFLMYINLCVPHSLQGGVLTLSVNNAYMYTTIQNRFLEQMNAIVAQKDWADRVALTMALETVTYPSVPSAGQETPSNETPDLNPSYLFETFVQGKSNQLVLAACKSVCTMSPNRYNPLFIYGGAGLGKTHLLHAIGHEVKATHPSQRVCYITAERFTNDLILSIKNNKTHEFRQRYRNIDYLLIDDIQFISGKESTQEEFFNTFNDLHNHQKQIVLTSDKKPSDIQGIEERIITRFSMGLVADIQPPDFETRCAILKKKAEARNYTIPQEVIEFLATQIKSNIRELEGALNRVIANVELNGIPLTIENITSTMSSLFPTSRRTPVTIDEIIEQVCSKGEINRDLLLSSNRTNHVAQMRQIAMYLGRHYTELKLQQVATAFGRKDHTTVIHAIEKVSNQLKENTRIKNLVDEIITALGLNPEDCG